MRMRKVVTGYSSVLLDLCQTEETLLSQMDGKMAEPAKKVRETEAANKINPSG
ncbi:MAG: hypothetical protein CM15mP62_17960 [Rhodospirillaceae bacterium]|nr:MAG: hypothetical protein CM15mP62_17960 [Rhodospirillaceae bacterium]